MPREIKFRVRTKMVLNGVPTSETFTSFLSLDKMLSGNQYIGSMSKVVSVDEFTGSVDRFGVEIYENDIVEYDKWQRTGGDMVEKFPLLVYFRSGEFRMGQVQYLDAGMGYSDNVKIIGNIYDNPHLVVLDNAGLCCKSFEFGINNGDFEMDKDYGYISRKIGSKITFCPFCGKKIIRKE